MSSSAAPVRPVKLGTLGVDVERRADGSMIVRNRMPLGSVAVRLTDRLDHWAAVAPDRVWLAQRAPDGAWQTVTYRDGRARVRRIAAALLARDLSAERPIAILSGNGIGHALLAVAALYVGIPYAPISPAYATLATDFGKLKGVIDLITPGLVYAADPAPFARALERAFAADVERITDASLAAFTSDNDAAVDAVRDLIGGDTIAKFLFTSGSTGVPKAVINTHRMLTTNVAQITAHFAYLVDEPPVLVDWAPWNHTAGGNHNFNLVLHNGGTLYIDEGKPTPSGIAATVRTLKEVSPNWYFNVPKGYAALLPHLTADQALRESFFRHVKLLWYAGAGMARHLWDDLDRLAVETTGERITILTGLGSTETGPFALAADARMSDAGLIGLPARGCDLKLVPTGEKFEARVRGANITPGYWRRPELSTEAFDREGFYKLGDALRFAVAGDATRGFYFDGRIAEDFKLATGTWVAVGPLRSAFIDHCAPYIQDAVLAGADQDYIGALVFLDVEQCRALASRPEATLAELASDATVRAHVADRLAAFAAAATGSSVRIERVILVEQAPGIDSAEATDKGSLNQRAVLANRRDLVDALFAPRPDAMVLRSSPR